MLLQTDLITSDDDFMALRGWWDDAVLRNPTDHSAFQSWAYVYNHWVYRKAGDGFKRELRLYVMRDHDEPIAVAPFWITTFRRFVNLRLMELIGDHGLDYLDFIAGLDAERAEIYEYLLTEVLRVRPWHLLILSELKAPSSSMLTAILNKNRIAYECIPCSVYVTVALPDSYDDYLALLGKSTRKRLLYDSNRLRMRHASSFTVYTRYNASFAVTLEKTQDIHQKRWNDAGHKGVFSSASQRALDVATNQSLSDSEMLRYFVLMLDERPVAALSGAQLGDTLYTHIMSVARDEAYRGYSPGMVMLAHTVEWCIEHGITTLDLGRGDELYKLRAGGCSNTSYRITIPRNRLLCSLAKIARRAGRPL